LRASCKPAPSAAPAGCAIRRTKDDVALYLAAQGLRDNGWRYQSPSELGRIYADLGWKVTAAKSTWSPPPRAIPSA